MENQVKTSDRLDVIEYQLRQVRREQTSQFSRMGNIAQPHQVRLAKTTSTSGGGSYPSEPSDTYGILFVDGTYTQTAGNNGHTLTNRKTAPAVQVAHSVDGKYYPVDTYVWVVEQNFKWWIIDVAGKTLTYFELTAALVYGTAPGADNAKVLEWDAGTSAYAATGATIRVYDAGIVPTTFGNWVGRGPLGGFVGYQGYAILGSSGRYEIVWMEEQARFLKFKLGSQLKYNVASIGCSEVESWDGREIPSGTITLYNSETDTAGVYQFWGPADAIGYAVYDDKAGKYKIVALETHAKYIEFTLASASAGVAAFTAGTAAGATVNSWWDGRKFWAGTTRDIQDPQGLFVRALQGGKGIARWNEQYDSGNGGYEVIECQSKAGWIDFTLTSALSSSSSSGATINDYGGSQQDVQNPGSTQTVYDDQLLWTGAPSGGKGRAIYDAVEDKYRIVSMGTLPAYGCLQANAGSSLTYTGSLLNLAFNDETWIAGMTRKTTTPNGLTIDRAGVYLIGFTGTAYEASPAGGTGVSGSATAYLYYNGSAMANVPLSSGDLLRIGGVSIRTTLAITHINALAVSDYIHVKIGLSAVDAVILGELTATWIGPTP